MSALSDLVKFAVMGEVKYVRGEHNEDYSRAGEAATELYNLQLVKHAAKVLDDKCGWVTEELGDKDYEINGLLLKNLAAALALVGSE